MSSRPAPTYRMAQSYWDGVYLRVLPVAHDPAVRAGCRQGDQGGPQQVVQIRSWSHRKRLHVRGMRLDHACECEQSQLTRYD